MNAVLAAAALAASLPSEALTCAVDLPPEVEYRVTYGPHWDGAWRLTAVRPAEGAPYFEVELLGVERADHRVDIVASHRRPALLQDMRALRQAAVVMIAEMNALNLRGDVPESRAQQRPLTVHLQGADGGLCADGYAHWPRIPGTYFFEALEMVRETVVSPGAVSEPWTAIRLHLRQIQSPWR
jgi:hypothetical protein